MWALSLGFRWLSASTPGVKRKAQTYWCIDMGDSGAAIVDDDNYSCHQKMLRVGIG